MSYFIHSLNECSAFLLQNAYETTILIRIFYLEYVLINVLPGKKV